MESFPLPAALVARQGTRGRVRDERPAAVANTERTVAGAGGPRAMPAARDGLFAQ